MYCPAVARRNSQMFRASGILLIMGASLFNGVSLTVASAAARGTNALGKEPPVASLQVAPSALDFGSQNVKSQSALQITVRNAGAASVTISGVTVTGAGFSLANMSAGLSLAPGQQTLIQISFRPVTSGTVSGTVTILSSGLASTLTVPLVGTGVSAPATSAQVKSAAITASTAAAATTASGATTATSGPLQVQLSWDASPSPVTGYRVHRGTVRGGPYSVSTANMITTLSYSDTSVAAGTTYYYVVTSVNQSGVESAYSNEAAATVPSSATPTTPSTPAPTGGPTSPVTGMALNGSAALNGTKLQLTSQVQNLVGSAWYSSPVNVAKFSNDFTFQLTDTATSSMGNGFTFAIQNAGATALGPSGGGLGYGPDKPSGASSSPNKPVAKSVAVKFDLVSNNGEGTNSTGLYKNGTSPTTPAVTLGGGVNLHSGDVFRVHMIYDGTTLSMNITDTAHTSETFTTSWPIDIPGTVGATTAYVGFTGATGSSVSTQDILSWAYAPTSTVAKTPVVYRTATLPVASSGPTFRTFTYASFPDTTGTILDATAIGQSVTFTVNIATAGTYDIKLGYKTINSRGISQFTINGANVGAPLDQYLASESYATKDYGLFTFASPGNYAFKFTTVGKNANASTYSISFDDFTLTPQ